MSTVYSVTQLNNEIKELLGAVPGYRKILVRGEISNYKAHSSGHHYMTLKDENAAIPAVMFRGDAMRLKFRLENGLKVIVQARVSSFPRTGQVQLYISEILPDGAGALNLAFEQLKRKLLSEGLFNECYKKPIPAYPENIALITSPTGAAVRDMIRILGRRWRPAKVVLYPAQVQGSGAAESIACAIALANAVGEADVILCGRGGGSMEDLWAFNEEIVARAIFKSGIPVISAVGHEPDVTISDFVADLRAPTPSGAAELAVPNAAEIGSKIHQFYSRMYMTLHRKCAIERERCSALAERLNLRTPANIIAEKRVILDRLNERRRAAQTARIAGTRLKLHTQNQRLLKAGEDLTRMRRQNFARLAVTLDAVSPLKVLARGYAVASDKKGAVITDASTLKPGDALKVRLSKGAVSCRVTGVTPNIDKIHRWER